MQPRKRGIISVLFSVGAAIGMAGCAGPDTTGPSRPPIPSFAESGQCGSWSCSTATCGYDPGNDPRGACCTGPTPEGYDPAPAPDCNPVQGNPPTCIVYTGCSGNYPHYTCTGFYTGPCNEV